MLQLITGDIGRPLRVLAIGAHPDDIEIGAGGTLLELVRSVPEVHVDVLVLTGTRERAKESELSAAAFLAGAAHTIEVHDLPDGRLPAVWLQAKNLLEGVAQRRPRPDIVLAPSQDEAHQDHRTIAKLLPTVFRDVLILGYEIGKWDGDLIRRPVYVSLPPDIAARKADLLLEHFPSQHARDWYDREVFLGLARLRGVECASRYAEAFTCQKLTLGFALGGRL